MGNPVNIHVNILDNYWIKFAIEESQIGMQEYLFRPESSGHQKQLPAGTLQFRKRTVSNTETKLLSKTSEGITKAGFDLKSRQENHHGLALLASRDEDSSKMFLKIGNSGQLNFQKARPKKKVDLDPKRQPAKANTDRAALETLSCTNIDNIIARLQRKLHARSSSGDYQADSLSTADEVRTSLRVLPLETARQPLRISDFELGQLIGTGKFGDVHICRHKATRMLFGLKKILKSTIIENNMLDQLITQLKIQYKLTHPNIVQLYAHFDDQYHIFLLMQYAPSGTLMSRIHNTEKYTSQVMAQMLEAISFTHRHRIIHRDIKPENIVVFFEDTFKLCDFGLAAFLGHDNETRSSFCGTLDYIAPQMKDLGLYSFSVDIWGLGVLCYEVLFGKAPFKEEITKWKKRGGKRFSNWNWKIDYPSFTTQRALDFMSNFLKQNPNERMSIPSALRSQFIIAHKAKERQFDAGQLSW